MINLSQVQRGKESYEPEIVCITAARNPSRQTVIDGTGTTVIASPISISWGSRKSSTQVRASTAAGVYAALAYYHVNQAEIEAEIAADETEADRIEAEHAGQEQIAS